MGLLERFPYVSELAYFANNPNVAGMMTQDGMVTLQPSLYGSARDSVYKNEESRLALRDYVPKSKLTNQQIDYFSGTPYAQDNTNAIKSIFARMISGDRSAIPSFEQDNEYRSLRQIGGLLGGY